MKLFYTKKEMQEQVQQRLYEESERFNNARKFEQIEHELYELRVAVEKAHARIDEAEELNPKWRDNGNETFSCPHCETSFPKNQLLWEMMRRGKR